MRRPTIAVPPGTVLQIGSDGSGSALGLHPNLTGLRNIYNQGRMAVIQRTGYPNLSRSHFLGTDIWSTGSMAAPQGPGCSGATSTRCRRRSIRSSAGTPTARCRGR